MEKKIKLNQKDFFYQDAAVPVIDQIIGFIESLAQPAKKTFENIWPYPIAPDVWFDLHEDLGYAFYDVNVNVRSVDFKKDHPGWNIDADAGVNSSYIAAIDIDIQLSPDFFKESKIGDLIRAELYNVVPHEMHHLTQTDGPFQRVSCPLTANSGGSGNFKYFMSSCEVPAFVIGFRGEANQSGRPVDELIGLYLNNQVKARLISSAESEKIKKAWLTHDKWHSDSSESVVREYVRLVAENRL